MKNFILLDNSCIFSDEELPYFFIFSFFNFSIQSNSISLKAFKTTDSLTLRTDKSYFILVGPKPELYLDRIYDSENLRSLCKFSVLNLLISSSKELLDSTLSFNLVRSSYLECSLLERRSNSFFLIS